MAEQYKPYQYRFYPTAEQEHNLARTFGSARFVYNLMLATRRDAWDYGKISLSGKDVQQLLPVWKKTESMGFLQEVSAVVLQQSAQHCDAAYQRFFKGVAEYPKFKKKNRTVDSATYMSNAFSFTQQQDGTGIVQLAKQSESLKIKWDRPLPVGAKPSRMTVKRDKAGRYFISILVKENILHLPPAENDVLGIDLGLLDFLVDDQGNKIQNPKHLQALEKKLAKAQKEASRKQLGSNNRRKANLKVARIWAKITDQRKDFHQQLSTRLIRENQTIIVETLKVQNMMKNKKLAKHIQNAGWSSFIEMLLYKAEWYGREIIRIDTFSPTTKTCSACGYVNRDLTLADRTWHCPCCWALHDRDVNAAINIKAVGLAVTACERWGEESPTAKVRRVSSGPEISPGESGNALSECPGNSRTSRVQETARR